MRVSGPQLLLRSSFNWFAFCVLIIYRHLCLYNVQFFLPPLLVRCHSALSSPAHLFSEILSCGYPASAAFCLFIIDCWYLHLHIFCIWVLLLWIWTATMLKLQVYGKKEHGSLTVVHKSAPEQTTTLRLFSSTCVKLGLRAKSTGPTSCYLARVSVQRQSET